MPKLVILLAVRRIFKHNYVESIVKFFYRIALKQDKNDYDTLSMYIFSLGQDRFQLLYEDKIRPRLYQESGQGFSFSCVLILLIWSEYFTQLWHPLIRLKTYGTYREACDVDSACLISTVLSLTLSFSLYDTPLLKTAS